MRTLISGTTRFFEGLFFGSQPRATAFERPLDAGVVDPPIRYAFRHRQGHVLRVISRLIDGGNLQGSPAIASVGCVRHACVWSLSLSRRASLSGSARAPGRRRCQQDGVILEFSTRTKQQVLREWSRSLWDSCDMPENPCRGNVPAVNPMSNGNFTDEMKKRAASGSAQFLDTCVGGLAVIPSGPSTAPRANITCGSRRLRRPAPPRAPLRRMSDGRGTSGQYPRQMRQTPCRRRSRGSGHPPPGQ